MKKKGSKKKVSFKKAGTKKPGSRKKSSVAKKKTTKRAAPAPRPVKRGASCKFVCSECYAEFILPANFSEETLSCPECLHIGKRPDEDFLRTVLIHKSQEKKSLAMTAGVAVLFALSALVVIWQASPFTASEPSAILMGISGVLLIALFVLLARYEANRWEVYF